MGIAHTKPSVEVLLVGQRKFGAWFEVTRLLENYLAPIVESSRDSTVARKVKISQTTSIFFPRLGRTAAGCSIFFLIFQLFVPSVNIVTNRRKLSKRKMRSSILRHVCV